MTWDTNTLAALGIAVVFTILWIWVLPRLGLRT
jgi:hypothetical protein